MSTPMISRWPLALSLLALGCSAAEPSAQNVAPVTTTPPSVEPAPSSPPSAAPASPPPSPSPVEACEATSPRARPLAVRVLPDDGEAPFETLIASANQSIRVFAYMMGYGATLDGLLAKARAGVDVRVILDGESQRDVNEKYRVRLEEAGAKVVYSDPAFRYMHAKVIVVDDARAIVSTSNYSRSFLLKERNFAADLDDADDVADLKHLFDADFTQQSPDLACTRLLVSPINARARLLALIGSAQAELSIESMQLADTEIRQAVIARKRAGVRVRAIVASPSWIGANTRAAEALLPEGVEVKWLGAPSVHAKMIVVDGKWAYLGSENLSQTSLDRNREIGLVFSDQAGVARLSTTFEGDWTSASSF